MSYTLKDRVLETSTSTGTGNFTLSGAQTGYQVFGIVGDGASIPYTIQGKNADGTLTGEWEVGVGTYHSSGNYITRDTVFESSNANAKVLFTAGDKDVFLDLPSELVVQGPNSATASDFVAFDGTSGKVIKDSGFSSASFATAAQGAKADTAVQTSQVGVANGVASLDSGGQVPLSQIPASLVGAVDYQGTWNASTNTPTLASGVGTKGYYYVVNVAGTTNLDGITDWNVGDWAVYSGTAWQKVDNTQSYPAAGIANSTGSSWGTSYSTTGSGTVVALQTSPLLVTPTLSGATVDNAAPYLNFASGAGTTVAAGRMWYDGTTGSWNLGMGGGNITQQVGEEIFVYGKASAAITEGQLVMKTGTVGASGVITFAPTSAGITNDNLIIGIATENIPLNGFGRITAFGVVHGINTSAFSNNDTLWYDPTSSTGGMTATKPTAPNVKCEVGTVINAGSGSSGSIQVEIIHGTQLGGSDSNVNIVSATNGNILTYDGTNTYWKNTSLTAGTGISVSASATGVLTITNTSPSSGGTVTSVTGTAPISVATGTTTPVISIPKATASVNGYLSSADWTTFNSKVSSPWSLSGSDVYYNSGNVGIGISAPTAQLQLYKSTGDASFVIENNGAVGTDTAYAQISSGSYRTKNIVYANGDAYILSTGNNFTVGTDIATPFTLVTDSVERIRIDAGGNVGIATLGPTEKLDVNGNAKATSFIKTGGVSTEFLKADGSVDSSTYVTSVSVDSANGFAGTSSGGATPTITLTTSITGMLKGNGTAISAGTAGTDYAVPTTASTWSASQRGTVTTDNDGSFDMSVTNNFKCTPTGTFALTFTNITAGQSGYVLLVNTGGYAVTAAATTKVNTTFLTTVSTAGTYLLSYFTDGTNVYVTTGGAMS